MDENLDKTLKRVGASHQWLLDQFKESITDERRVELAIQIAVTASRLDIADELSDLTPLASLPEALKNLTLNEPLRIHCE